MNPYSVSIEVLGVIFEIVEFTTCFDKISNNLKTFIKKKNKKINILRRTRWNVETVRSI